jgi:hypothetical protein
MSERSAEIHRRQLDDIADLAGMTTEELLAALQPYPLREWAVVLRELLPGVVLNFGNAASVLAVDYYNQRRSQIVPKAKQKQMPFNASLDMIPKNLLDEDTGKTIDWFINSVFKGIDDGTLVNKSDPTKAVEFLDDIQPEEVAKIQTKLDNVIRTNVMNYSRKTIDKIAEIDPAPIKKKRSVNTGGCEWCKLLHARGYIKEPKFKPLIPLDDVTGHFHEGCRCTVDIAYGEVVPPIWYDKWIEEYKNASGDLGTTEPIPLISEMRRRNAEAAKKTESKE